jgi:hypothetical protein
VAPKSAAPAKRAEPAKEVKAVVDSRKAGKRKGPLPLFLAEVSWRQCTQPSQWAGGKRSSPNHPTAQQPDSPTAIRRRRPQVLVLGAYAGTFLAATKYSAQSGAALKQAGEAARAAYAKLEQALAAK